MPPHLFKCTPMGILDEYSGREAETISLDVIDGHCISSASDGPVLLLGEDDLWITDSG